MPSNSSSLGRCPQCKATITSAYLLIEYETADGVEVFAECPICTDVVTPR